VITEIYRFPFDERMKMAEHSRFLFDFKHNLKAQLKDVQKLHIHVHMMREVNIFKQGKSFGELALINDAKRAATVQVSSASVALATLVKEDYTKIIGTSYKDKLEQAYSTLKKFEMFKQFTGSRLQPIHLLMKELNVGKEQYLYEQGAKVDGIYFLVSGKAKKYKKIEKNC